MNASPLLDQLIDGLAMTVDPVRFAAQMGFPNLDDWQKSLLLERENKRTILCMGRQVGKTEAVSLAAAYEAAFFKNSQILLLSASLRQSQLLMSRVKNHISKLASIGIIRVRRETELKIELQSGSVITALPSSESTIRGYANIDLLLIDEASHVDTDLYKATRAFLAVSNGRLILLSTPHSTRGFFFEAWNNQDEDWTRIKVTTEECSRVSKEWLSQEKKSIGDAWYRQEYLAEFIDSAYALIPYDVIQRAIDPSLTMLDINLDSDDDPWRVKYDAKPLDIDLDSSEAADAEKRGDNEDGI